MWLRVGIFKFAFPGKFLQNNRNVRDLLLLLPGFDKLTNLELIFCYSLQLIFCQYCRLIFYLNFQKKKKFKKFSKKKNFKNFQKKKNFKKFQKKKISKNSQKFSKKKFKIFKKISNFQKNSKFSKKFKIFKKVVVFRIIHHEHYDDPTCWRGRGCPGRQPLPLGSAGSPPQTSQSPGKSIVRRNRVVFQTLLDFYIRCKRKEKRGEIDVD